MISYNKSNQNHLDALVSLKKKMDAKAYPIIFDQASTYFKITRTIGRDLQEANIIKKIGPHCS